MLDFMTDNLDGLSTANLRNYVRALRGIIRIERARFASEVARNAAALTHYAQMAEQARVLAEKGDGDALVAMFAPADDEHETGSVFWTDSGTGELVEDVYGINGLVCTRVNGVVQ